LSLQKTNKKKREKKRKKKKKKKKKKTCCAENVHLRGPLNQKEVPRGTPLDDLRHVNKVAREKRLFSSDRIDREHNVAASIELEHNCLLASHQIPQQSLSRSFSESERHSSRGMNGHGSDSLLVRFDLQQAFPVFHAPHTDGAVRGSREQAFLEKRKGGDRASVTLQSSKFFLHTRFEDPNRRVGRSRCQKHTRRRHRSQLLSVRRMQNFLRQRGRIQPVQQVSVRSNPQHLVGTKKKQVLPFFFL
jgi:hypothetical protein